ncbi:chlororespiratory reduction protein 7 [Nodosilinea sp. E11]|uniref:chlororespiratory reduction protein 7 n=1 Tax=Nodosilinea sp. E11 TaxID=3037479 RepID=UPI00293529E5|nr:chlororespiratory reduction protein 7 [Nodosilinea sp. E11]WOD39028.1 chlororespiratory reduction protein 7 [Nodosilinea sp. E11]
MPDAIMYQEDMFVVLMPGLAEEFLTPAELLDRLMGLLGDRQDNLPRDLQRFSNLATQAQHLRDTGCELELAPGEAMQWYIVRLEK